MIPLPTKTPALAVTIPIESTFVTSSYVKTPPTVTLPLNVPVAAFSPLIVILGVPVNPADVPVILALAVIKLEPFVNWLLFVGIVGVSDS